MIWNSSEYVTEHAGIADNIIALYSVLGCRSFYLLFSSSFLSKSKPVFSQKPSKEEEKINHIKVIRSIYLKISSIDRNCAILEKKNKMICRIFFIRFFNLQKLTLSLTKYEFCTPSQLLPITS